MKTTMKFIYMALAMAAAACMAADAPGYTCVLRVGGASAEQSVSKDGAKKGGGRRTKTSVKTKTTSCSLTWPVRVTVTGKTPPPAGSVKLKCYFMGTTNGRPALLGERTVPVDLDEKGVFKTDVESPTEKLVHTTTTKKTRSGSRRNRNRSTSVKSETTGSRVTGCIIQLIVKGKVERSYSSNPVWSKAAKTTPLSEADILGTK